jgi:hypothetical protein
MIQFAPAIPKRFDRTFMTFYSVFSVLVMRKAFNSPIQGAEDLLALSLVVIVALSNPFGARTGAHIEIEVLESRMSKAFAKWSMVFVKILGICLLAIQDFIPAKVEPSSKSTSLARYRKQASKSLRFRLIGTKFYLLKPANPAKGGVCVYYRVLLTGLDCGNVNRCWSFLTLLHIEAYFLTFIKRLVTIASDSCVVDEYVLATIFRRNKAETLRCVEPLNCTSTQNNTLYIKTTKWTDRLKNRQFKTTTAFRPDLPLTITFHV